MRPGKDERLKRIFDPADGKAVCVAADHGWMSDMTFNVVELRRIVGQVVKGGADAILLSMGQAARLGDLLRGRNTPALLVRADWMNLTRMGGANELANAIPVQKLRRVAAGTASDALNLGASGITIYYFIGYDDEFEAYNIELCATFARECRKIGLPCIIEPMAVGGLVTGLNIVGLLQASARIAVEIGADALKIPYTNDVDTFRELCEAADVPVMMLGGARSFRESDALEIVAEGIQAGAAGVVFGRNVTKARDPELMVRRICDVVHGRKSVDEVYLEDLGPRIRVKATPSKCTGCRICELACQYHQTDRFGVGTAAMRVDTKPLYQFTGKRALHYPIVCTLCGECVEACPEKVLTFNPSTGVLQLDPSGCTGKDGCRKCVKACPLDIIGFDELRGLPVFCDMCDGAPMCAKWCDRSALEVVPQKKSSKTARAAQA